MFKLLKKKLKKYNKFYFARVKYTTYYESLKINDKVILLEAQHGNSIMGNIFYIAKELSSSDIYKDFDIYVSIRGRKVNTTKSFLEQHNINNIKVITLASKEFFKILATAKYIITDTALTPNYIKKDGQILVNTWHGTPLKTLGKKVKNEPQNIANVQKNFIQSDYLLYPNNFTKEHMIEDYMLDNICNAKTLMCGYPRNTIFFDNESRSHIREDLELQNKEIIVYMPTWRGSVSNVSVEIQNTYITYYLLEIDKQLKDNQILYVQLHPFVNNKINFKMFKNIKKIPAKYETYEFLNIADCLITDYSSVFFDFAITRKKIILFTYDKEQYLSDRGMYINMNDLPFPQVNTVDDLVKELDKPVDYDDTSFLNTYCKYENANATKLLCEKIIFNKKNEIIEENISNNGKENVLLYVGNLAKNGITSSMLNLCEIIDKSKYNYYITFVSSKVKQNKEILFNLPKGINYIATNGKMNINIKEKIIFKLFNKKIISTKFYMKKMAKALNREIDRTFYNIKFSNVIQFNGYEFRKILMFSKFNAKTSIYVHSDMNNEIKVRKNQRKDVLEYAYQNYDNIIVVTNDLIDSTQKFMSNSFSKIKVINNAINYKEIKRKSLNDVTLDENTELTVEYDRLLEILNSSGKKFINIGRFSPEKGHIRLIDAFYRIWKNNKDCYLIIIGGCGKDYNKIAQKANEIECKDNIVLIKSISNPYSILNKCDYFVLSSFYEGFGIVIAEADILNIPVISTDIVGPRTFMLNHNGTLVENSEEGIYQGMLKLLNGEVKLMNIDFEQYNQKVKNDFENLLKL